MSEEWANWSKHVLAELVRLNDGQEKLDGKLDKKITELHEKLNRMNTDIVTLKLKAGVWGLCGAAIPACITLAVIVLKNYV